MSIAEKDYRNPDTALEVVRRARGSINRRTGIRWTDDEMAEVVGCDKSLFGKWGVTDELSARVARGVRRLDRRVRNGAAK